MRGGGKHRIEHGPGLPGPTPLQNLARTHALMVGGEAVMAVSLADSMFLSVSPDAARGKVLAFLLVSMAPFLVVAPLIGPAIDRMKGGQRLVIALVAALRSIVMVAMVFYVDSLTLFPLAFAALVLSKTYAISKSALVPSTVESEDKLVDANSKLGQVGGITGFVAAVPAAVLQLLSTQVALVGAAVVFAFACASALQLPRDVVTAAEQATPLEVRELRSPRVARAATMMRILRGAVGFMFFHLAFWLRHETAGTAWFGFALALAGLCTLLANTVAPAIRRRLNVDTMLLVTVAVVAAAGLIAGWVGSITAGLILTALVNAAAAIGRLAFEAIVQQDAPDANRGRAFAKFETQNQLAWVAAGVVPVLLSMAGPAGFYVVGVVGVMGCVLFVRQSPGGRRRVTESRGARARGRGLQAH